MASVNGETDVLISSLKSLLEILPGHSESLGNITKVINDTLPGSDAAMVHKCLAIAFPDLQAQQGEENDEIYYLGIKFAQNNTPSDINMVKWLQERFTVDPFGNLSCQTVRDIVVKEAGYAKQSVSIGNLVRKAFPNVYVRRSDRLRWYCGIALPEKEITEEEQSRKIWLQSACNWLRCNMSRNPNTKERCCVVFAALAQFCGKTSIDNSMAAVKCVFPNVIRKTVDRNAYYIGISFNDVSLRDNLKTTPIRTPAPKPEILNDDEMEVVQWLRKALGKKAGHREKVADVANLMSKKAGLRINEKSCLKYVRKAFPDIIYRKRDRVGHISGYEIRGPYKPRDPWKEKAVAWLQQVFESRSIDYCEKYSPFLELMKTNLNCVNYSKLSMTLKEAFPPSFIRKTLEGTFVYGITFSQHYNDVSPPEFLPTDSLGDFSVVDIRTADVSIEEMNTAEENGEASASSSQSPFKSNNTSCTSGRDIKQLEIKVTKLTSQIADMTNEMKEMREELATSCRQKDTLIVQLQQTLMLLTQQHFQRMVKGDGNPAASVTESSTPSASLRGNESNSTNTMRGNDPADPAHSIIAHIRGSNPGDSHPITNPLRDEDPSAQQHSQPTHQWTGGDTPTMIHRDKIQQQQQQQQQQSNPHQAAPHHHNNRGNELVFDQDGGSTVAFLNIPAIEQLHHAQHKDVRDG